MPVKRRLLSHQSDKVYSVLSSGEPFSAKEIAKKLGILPNAVYRTAKTLSDLGLVERIEGYPALFRARPNEEALENYLSHYRNALLSEFNPARGSKHSSISEEPSISFIRTRSQFLETTNNDIKGAKNRIDHLVSGMELPAETMLAYKEALDREVKLRFLVQNKTELNSDMLDSWQKMGLLVRQTSLLEARIIIFDSKIVYITSYSPGKKEEAIGVRFAYSPVARQMSELFERRWTSSHPIQDV